MCWGFYYVMIKSWVPAWLAGRMPREEVSESQWVCLQMWLAPDVSELNELPSEKQLYYLRWLEGKGSKGETHCLLLPSFPKWLTFVLISLLPQKITSFSLFNVELYCSQTWVFLGLGLHWGCNIKLCYPETFSSWSLAFCHTYWLWDHLVYGSTELT